MKLIDAGSERYRALFEAMDEGFCIIEFIDGPGGPLDDYVHVEANAAYALNAGIPDVVGQKLREMVPDEADEWIAQYRPVLLTGEPIHFRQELVATKRHLDLSAFRVGTIEDRLVAVLFKDVSAEVEAQRTLRDINAVLEARVAEALAEREAAEAALRQAQKMEAVGHLTGGLAHDFNNLLGSISGALEMIGLRLAQGRDQDVSRYLDAGLGAARRAAALTHRLLAFSRRQTLSPAPLVINDLLADFAELVRRTVGPAYAIEVAQAGDLGPALVDANQLENALLNLCINARDAMPHGGAIRIVTANLQLDETGARDLELEAGEYVSICVEDNGSGIPEDILGRVFDPFFTTKPIGEGTGLGLSMVYGFARQSHGAVHLTSTTGQGTAVCIYLPRYQGEVAAPAPPGARSDAGGKVAATVLVIDDEAMLRMFIVDALSDLGYECLEAGDGPEGIAILESPTRIDLLVTDVGLPGGLNGRQVADAARGLRPGLKVLFVTGYAESAVMGDGTFEPDMAVLTKPFAFESLADKVADLLQRA